MKVRNTGIMNIIHIESGLGNQMLNYAEYLAIKSVTDAECYVETMLYDIPGCSEGISQWNGFELNRIFGINPPNIKDFIGEDAYSRVIEKVEKGRFWEKHWNYPPYIVSALNDEGINVTAHRGELHLPAFWMKCQQTEPYPKESLKHKIRVAVVSTHAGFWIQHWMTRVFQAKEIKRRNIRENIFIEQLDNAFMGHCMGLMQRGSGIESMEKDLQKIFRFPEFNEPENLKLKELIQGSNSVSLHVRRGDFTANNVCYKYGYFKRAVRLIKKHVENPVFFVFSDPDSCEWCKENLSEFALDVSDRIYYVNHNKGAESFRDMQLMSLCKHNVITKSSFGWWGALLNANPNKITCAPDPLIYSTHTI